MLKNRKRLLSSLTMFVVIFAAQSVFSQTQGELKLLAKRAALIDAYNNLAAAVEQIPITSDESVANFIDENEEVTAEFYAFIKEARLLGKPVYNADGSCDLSVEIDLAHIVDGLRKIQMKFYHIGHIHNYTLDQMMLHVKNKTFIAKGHGMPLASPVPVSILPKPDPIISPLMGIPGWEGVLERGKLDAERAAKAEAYINLEALILDLRITARLTVGEFIALNEEMGNNLTAYVTSLQQIGPYRYLPGGAVEATVQISVAQVIKELKKIYKEFVHYHGEFKDPYLRKLKFIDIRKWYRGDFITAYGTGMVKEKYRRKQE